MRGGMKISEEKSKVRGPNLPQLPMSSTPGLAGATLSKHGRGRWMLSQKQSCKPTQNAHGTGKEKYYSHVLKIRSLIRYQESGAGSALLPPPGDAVWAQMCTVCGRAGAQGMKGCSLPGSCCESGGTVGCMGPLGCSSCRNCPWPLCSDHEQPGELWCGSGAAPPASKAQLLTQLTSLPCPCGTAPGHSCRGEAELPHQV